MNILIKNFAYYNIVCDLNSNLHYGSMVGVLWEVFFEEIG